MNPFKYLIMIPFGWVLRILYQFTGNYGFSLVLFSLLINLILLPMFMKSKKSMMKMTRITPMLAALQKKYGDDKQRYNQAAMELYKEEGVSATGGCLWSLLPIIILIPLYYVIRSPLTYIIGLSGEEIDRVIEVLTSCGVEINTGNYYYQIEAASHIHANIEAVRQAIPGILDLNYNFFGIDLSAQPSFMFWKGGVSWNSIGLFLIPILSGGSQFFSSWLAQKLNTSVAVNDKGEHDAAAAAAAASASSMKMMLYMMPLISVWIGFTMPASISVYWIAQAVFRTLQDTLLTKHYRKAYDEEDAKKKLEVLQKEAEEAEKARKRAEKRAAGILDGTENTSRKKLKQQREQKNQPAETEEREPEDRKGYSGDPERPYSRGRAYKPDRYRRGRHQEEDGSAAIEAPAPESAEPAKSDAPEQTGEE